MSLEIVRKETISERMCEQSGVIEVPKISGNDKCLRHSKFFPQDRICERICEHIGVLEVPKILSQESVEASQKCSSGANF